MSTKPTTDELAAMVERLLRHDDGEGDGPVFLPEVRAEAIALLVRHMEGRADLAPIPIKTTFTYKAEIVLTTRIDFTATANIRAASMDEAMAIAQEQYGEPYEGQWMGLEWLDKAQASAEPNGDLCKVEIQITAPDGNTSRGHETIWEG